MRWLRRILITVVALVLVLGVYGFFLVRRSFPQIDGEILVPGLREAVTVVRDSDGIPHIYASNGHDLYLAQGYVEAQDRFWQMDIFRHIGAGRLAEMFGESQVDADKFLRSLDLVSLAEAELQSMDQGTRNALDWYAEGVNAFLADHDGAGVSLEYAVLGLINSDYTIEPWHPVNTLTWGKVMSFDLSVNLREEVERSVLSAELPVERIEQLFPPFPDRHPVIVGNDELSTSAVDFDGPTVPAEAIAVVASAGRAVQQVSGVSGGGFEGIGSNNWVVSGRLTETGKPILANDPHLGNRMPSIWYQIALHCTGPDGDCPQDVAGFTFPGNPGVILGHNENIAWGVTTENVDTQDLYIERINPDDPNQYEVDGEWVDMAISTETIDVGGGEGVTFQVKTTRHGPVISGIFIDEDEFDGSVADPDEPYVVALRWQSLEPATLQETFLALNNAENYDDFLAATSLWDIATQNVVYADIDGNIAYQSTGEIPVRPNHDGRYPVPGWSSEYEWEGLVPFDQMPSLFNPDSGYIASANQPVTKPGSTPLKEFDAAHGYRADRIESLIEAGSSHSIASTAQMQMDERDGGAAVIMPYLVGCGGCVGSDEGFQEIVGILEDWSSSLQATGESKGAAAYMAVWRHLLAETFHDELPEEYWPEGGARWFETMRNLVEAPDDPWWDDVTTSRVESRDEIIERAIIAAHTELVAELGANSEDWAWGALHVAHFDNETLGQSGIAPIEWLFNRTAPERVGGSQSLVNAAGWDPDKSYEVDWIPSFRMVIDLADLSRSTAINSTGNSGHAFHRHYDDMIEPWTDGDQHSLRWSRDQVERDQEGTLTLLPASG